MFKSKLSHLLITLSATIEFLSQSSQLYQFVAGL
jgi:hypothetical protein